MRRLLLCVYLFVFSKTTGEFAILGVGAAPVTYLPAAPLLRVFPVWGRTPCGSGREMKRERSRSYEIWTPEDDRILAESVLSSLRRGGTQKAGIEEAAERLGRSYAAASYRWNRFVRKDYAKELAALRRSARSKGAFPQEIPPSSAFSPAAPDPSARAREVLRKISALLEELEELFGDGSVPGSFPSHRGASVGPSLPSASVSPSAPPSGRASLSASALSEGEALGEKGKGEGGSSSREKPEDKGEQRPPHRRATLGASTIRRVSPLSAKKEEGGGREIRLSLAFAREPGSLDEKSDALTPILEALRDLEDS
ncbi:RsfA family transcription factor [Brockia lithotrophica]|uniref:RsfA family transcription factor n=2 Tax=Brockia lithotrophica TaxID=933949 RepID=A0A660L6L4_9BACL|nr:RsfA family transcription factor [Brockia lithotrophica]